MPPETEATQREPQTFTLAFRDRALESEYALFAARGWRRSNRIAWGTGIVAWLAFAAIDPLTTTSAGNLRVLLSVRFGLLPILLVLAASAWVPVEQLARWRPYVNGVGSALLVWSLVLVCVLLPEPRLFDFSQAPIPNAILTIVIYVWFNSRVHIALLAMLPPTLLLSFLAWRLYPMQYGGLLILWSGLANLLGTIALWQLEQLQRKAFLASRALARERERSDALLHNMLPAAIAERLKSGGGRIADHFAEATVLFADIVGFTTLSQEVSPVELVETLDELFTAFDAIAGRFGLAKIKTIGDAYMAVAGVPLVRADHADAACNMALALREIVAAKPFAGGRRLELRIGIHSGPAVAGVIGTTRLAYDLWGDTVNTASRMESHGVPGMIHISDATAALLGERFTLSDRGVSTIKGKGNMRTWLLEGRSAASLPT